MTDATSILVPIRFPLTVQSEKTLATAGRLAREYAPAGLTVLHVNLYQKGTETQKRELTRAVSSILDDVEASVSIQQGFLLEEVILEEARQLDAEIIVVGESKQAPWRKLLNRLLSAGPEVGVFLRENATDTTKVMEVDAGDETSTVEVT